jgi:hypothetical protein
VGCNALCMCCFVLFRCLYGVAVRVAQKGFRGEVLVGALVRRVERAADAGCGRAAVRARMRKVVRRTKVGVGKWSRVAE